MEMNEMYLKTAFCCMACDGSIAKQEIESLKQYVSDNKNAFLGVDIENTLNAYISEINSQGTQFLAKYLKDVSSLTMSENEQLALLKLAIDIIESDEQIEYSEVAFFKKIRRELTISDESILAIMPDKGDYLLPDIIDDSPMEWLHSSFENIKMI